MRSAWAVSLGCVAILATLPVSAASADSEQWQWTVPLRLTQGVEGTSYSPPSLDVEPGGTALLTWSQAEPEDHFRVYVTWHVPGDGWGQPLPLENVNGTGKHPAAALDGQGRALVAFRRGAFPEWAIWATHLRPEENSGKMHILGPEGSPTTPLVAAAGQLHRGSFLQGLPPPKST